MAHVDNRGLVDDSDRNNLTVAGSVTTNVVVLSPAILANSGSVAIPAAGFYFLSASGVVTAGNFTGSVPSAAAWPGAFLTICDVSGGYEWQLTGTAVRQTAAAPVFVMPPGAATGSSGGVVKTQGTKLTIVKSGSISMVSDSQTWNICAGSGSYTIA